MGIPPRDGDASHATYLRARPRLYGRYSRTSRYLVMRDGVRIAIDVCLPRGIAAGVQVPTIVRQTRYFRRFRVHPAARPFLTEATLDPMNAPMRDLFTSRGYAWVDVDVRGSGASFGERPCPWYLEGEVKDGAEIVDFIVRQPWSNGKVGSTGVSYDGTTAEFLAVNRHPAVLAIAPRFSLFDVYADVAFPGGLHQSWFTQTWERANAALDRNAPGEFVALVLSFALHGSANARVVNPGSLPNLVARAADRADVQRWAKNVLTWALGGVPPVDDDRDDAILAQAIASHGKNWNVDEGAVDTTFRDDSPPSAPLPGFTSEAFSPRTYANELRDVAVLSYGGWFDSGYANAAAKRHEALAGAQNELLLGPWVHGGALVMDPDGKGKARFDHSAELLRFFDRHLLRDRSNGAPPPAVRYFMMGSGEWRSSARWPPEGTRSVALHFAEAHRLSNAAGTGVDVYEVDPRTRAGRRSRWRTLVSPFLHADGAGRSQTGLLVYETVPLERDVEIVGHPVLVLCLSSSTPDGAIFAYLDDVDREGNPRLVTEGLLRTIHRTRLQAGEGLARVEVSFLRTDALAPSPTEVVTHAVELLPLAMLLRRGHRIRLSLAGADVDHFKTPAAAGPTVWRVDRAGSRLLLPTQSERIL
jgi:putative CocE/NonD family hydrolase